MNYQLIWEDQFLNDGAPDSKIWKLETGGHGFGNNEFQYYTDHLKNCYIKDQILHIKAYKENYLNREYTSAKLTTEGIKSIMYGKIEVMAKVPKGKGTWPAIWLLSDQFRKIGWPLCGEIDMMESVGRNPNKIHFSLHSKTFNFHKENQPTKVITDETIYSDFHEYAIIWDEKSIAFLYDQKIVETFYKKQNDGLEEWPFNQSFYLILNLAIGGNWGGAVDDSLFPIDFLIKYVKVYERSE